MEYHVLLKSWGLEQFIPNFEEEGINDESFKLLDAETINQIFVKKGPRLIFNSKFKEVCSPQQKDLIIISQDTLSTASTDTIISNDSEIEYEVDESYFDNEQPLFQSTLVGNPESVFQNEPQSSQSLLNTLVFKVPQTPCFSPKRQSDSTDQNEINKKRKLDSVFTQGIEKYLSENPDGKLALASKYKLSESLRNKISKLVIGYLISKSLSNANYEIKSDIFLKAASEIVQVFPGEQMETYFIPFYSNKNGTRHPARGKLWSRYLNVRAALRAADNTNKAVFKEKPEEIVDPLNPHLVFLKAAVKPFNKVLDAWEQTFQQRTRLYKNSTIVEIYDDIPALKTEFGIQLLESDFNQMYDEKIDVIYAEWSKVSSAILKEAEERRIKTFEDITDTSTRALLTLPFLFSPNTIRKSANKTWRPTRTEIQQSFFYIEKSLDDLEIQIQRRKHQLEIFGQPLQPFGVSIGDIFFICINDVRYKCESNIRCLELLYKCFHALRLEYPPESKEIFLMIQDLIVFKMGSVGKKGSTASVLSDLMYHLKQM